MKKLQTPITATATFKTRMIVPAGSSGTLINGCLAFGDGSTENNLIKCGARLRASRAFLVQGPLDGGRTASAAIESAVGKVLELIRASYLAR